MVSFGLLLAGLALLLVAGDALVRGAGSLALRLGLSPMLIGLTVVGFGTSSPELFVSVIAALEDSPGIAAGNVVGSNIANILLIVAVGALLRPVPTHARSLVRDGGMLLAATSATITLAWTGGFVWWHGLGMIAALAVYLALIYRQDVRRGTDAAEVSVPAAPAWRSLLFVLAGLVGLIIGAELLVDGAVDLARGLGVSDTVIGVTVVAVGTSLPELAVTLIAARRGQTDMMLGNIVGSNIFNCLGILGATAIVAPLPIDLADLGFDLVAMGGATLLLLLVASTGNRINRREAILLLGLYAGFVFVTIRGIPTFA